MKNRKKYKILSAFTGAGGLDRGFHGGFKFLDKYYEELPFETVIASDINAKKRRPSRGNMQQLLQIFCKRADIKYFQKCLYLKIWK